MNGIVETTLVDDSVERTLILCTSDISLLLLLFLLTIRVSLKESEVNPKRKISSECYFGFASSPMLLLSLKTILIISKRRPLNNMHNVANLHWSFHQSAADGELRGLSTVLARLAGW